MTYEVELKPCPFCGGKASMVNDFFGKDFFSSHTRCNDCSSMSGTYTHEHQAIEAWNRRA